MNAYYVDDRNERSWGWGICHLCGHDCESESDYDEIEQRSACEACRERQVESDEERLRLEVFARR